MCYVLPTHETTLGAILRHSSLGELPIAYMQHVEIESRGEFMRVAFGEATFSGKERDFDWQIANHKISFLETISYFNFLCLNLSSGFWMARTRNIENRRVGIAMRIEFRKGTEGV